MHCFRYDHRESRTAILALDMRIVFVIAADWALRTALRAQLRELGIEALGMDSADDIARLIPSGRPPDAVVLEAAAELLGDSRIQKLIHRAPTILIASRTVAVPLPPGHVVLYRPIRIADIVDRVSRLLARNHAA